MYLFVFLNEDLHNNILELDVQHGGHSLLLRSHKCGSKYYSHVGGNHQVVLTVTAHTVEKSNGLCEV